MIKYILFDDKTKEGKFYLFMGLCEGSIQGLLPADPLHRPPFIKDKLRQLLEGLVYLHENNIAHHDIKPDNVLIDQNGWVKICDFGVAEKFDPGVGCKIFFGTPAYQPPELISTPDTCYFDGRAGDLWAVGVLLHLLLTGSLPFKGDSIYEMMESIRAADFKMPHLNDIELSDLLNGLLQKDPSRRLTAKEAFSHPWFSKQIPDVGAKKSSKTRECCQTM